MEIRRHSHTAEAAYHDLVSLLLDEAVSDIFGSCTLREIRGKGYWYDRYRIGTEIKERYLGEDNPGATYWLRVVMLARELRRATMTTSRRTISAALFTRWMPFSRSGPSAPAPITICQ